MAATKVDLATAMANVTALLDLAQWHMMENMTGNDDGYQMDRKSADQVVALLIVTNEYAENAIASQSERA